MVIRGWGEIGLKLAFIANLMAAAVVLFNRQSQFLLVAALSAQAARFRGRSVGSLTPSDFKQELGLKLV